MTIMIATKDRHDDLAITLHDLRRQDYQNLEIIVIDDASTPPIESIVKPHWPDARLIRHESPRGQSSRRNEGFGLANGKYILQLDDDCSLRDANGISMSVDYMEATPRCPGIAYRHFEGREMPLAVDTLTGEPGNCATFVGAAVFLRKATFEETVGYREFFVGYSEEAELSLQLLKRGKTLSYRPEIVALHRCSSHNRNGPRAWTRGLRNNLWTILIHCPASRIPVEAGWKVGVAAWDALRLRRGRLLYKTLVETVEGLGKVWKLREPLDRLGLRRYDALRAYAVLPYAMFEDPPPRNWMSLKPWVNRRRRVREGSFDVKRP